MLLVEPPIRCGEFDFIAFAGHQHAGHGAEPDLVEYALDSGACCAVAEGEAIRMMGFDLIPRKSSASKHRNVVIVLFVHFGSRSPELVATATLPTKLRQLNVAAETAARTAQRKNRAVARFPMYLGILRDSDMVAIVGSNHLPLPCEGRICYSNAIQPTTKTLISRRFLLQSGPLWCTKLCRTLAVLQRDAPCNWIELIPESV